MICGSPACSRRKKRKRFLLEHVDHTDVKQLLFPYFYSNLCLCWLWKIPFITTYVYATELEDSYN
uniref:Uncharacterized protein n=1 Tax=Arundo donax TaxID=35708 RepID=A0A0A9C2V4_ARUDO